MSESTGIKVCVRVRPPFDSTANKHAKVASNDLAATPSSNQSVGGKSVGTDVSSPWIWNAKSCSIPKPALTRDGASTLTSADYSSSNAAEMKNFQFSQVFHPGQTTFNCYESLCRPLVRSFLNGYDACIFAYGQTGSGKTHTISGSWSEQGELGFLPLAVNDIFKYMAEQESSSVESEGNGGKRCVLRAAFIELYNENLRDLLAYDTPLLTIAEDPLHGTSLPNLECRVVSNLEEVLDMVQEGQARRVMGVNSVHEHSSRSHTIFQLTFESRAPGASGKIVQSVFNIVDLAGSETNYVAPNTVIDSRAIVSERATLGDLANVGKIDEMKRSVAKKNMEGGNIRKSLLALQRVVEALALQQQKGSSATGVAKSSSSSFGRSVSSAAFEKENSMSTFTTTHGGVVVSTELPVNNKTKSSISTIAKNRSRSGTPPPPAAETANTLVSNNSSSGFIPFRDSKLTRLLRNALSGNSQAAIICTINPNEIKETLNTLRFASKAQVITKEPTSQVVVEEQGSVLAKLEEELERVRGAMAANADQTAMLLEKEKDKAANLENQKALMEARAATLQARCANLERLFLGNANKAESGRGSSGRPSAKVGNGCRAPSAPSSTDSLRAKNDKVVDPYFRQLRQMNMQAICAIQDELTKEMLQSQRSKLDKFETEVVPSMQQKLADLEAQLKTANQDHSSIEKDLKAKVARLEAENSSLRVTAKKSRDLAVQFARDYEQEAETLDSGIPSGFCGAKVNVKKAPRPTLRDIFEKYPELKELNSLQLEGEEVSSSVPY